MAYASFNDMLARFGETELIRLSAPDGQLDGGGDRARVALALSDATALIDSYIRRRYTTPLAPVPPEIVAACCAIARHGLAQGEGRVPTDQMTEARKEALRWLESLAAGDAALPSAEQLAPASTFARTSDRPPLLSGGGLL